jgi:hypothetical protein
VAGPLRLNHSRKGEAMTPREVYLAAAERVFLGQNNYSCLAVDDAQEKGVFETWSPLCKKYRAVFSQDGSGHLYLFNDEENAKEIRILALCFMAAIAATR